jgi:threonine dehydratase
MITLPDVQEAQARIAPHIRHTPLVASQALSRELGTRVYLKLELFQKTGSFKPRAAFNKMLRLSAAERERGVVAVSGGNFAQGVAYAAGALGVRALILMPAYTPANYLDATRSYGAEVQLLPDIRAAFAAAEAYRREGRIFLHPYDDPDIMAGGGTLGLELVADVPELTDVFVSVGGGGLFTGVAVAVKGLRPEARVWTVETEGADALGRALQAGQVVHFQPTSLARTLGAPNVAAEALAAAQRLVAQHLLVSDQEAYRAQRFLLERAKVLTELAAACTLAAARRVRAQLAGARHVVLVLCGGNVSLDDLADYRQRFEGEATR